MADFKIFMKSDSEMVENAKRKSKFGHQLE